MRGMKHGGKIGQTRERKSAEERLHEEYWLIPFRNGPTHSEIGYDTGSYTRSTLPWNYGDWLASNLRTTLSKCNVEGIMNSAAGG